MHAIRHAKLEDAAAIQEIYAPYVAETQISFEYEPPSVDEIAARMREGMVKFPWLVCELEGQVAGYAYAGAHRSRCAYEWSVETSVYVRRGFHGRGVGRALYARLFGLLRSQGAVNVFAGITLPNEASVRLHESLGFVKCGQFRDIGFKQGKWWDVGWWQLQLQKPSFPQPLEKPERS